MKDFSFDYAEEGETSDKNMACKYIEVCQCPEGYTGTSCEVKKFDFWNLIMAWRFYW